MIIKSTSLTVFLVIFLFLGGCMEKTEETIAINEPTNWKESSLFESESFTMIGEEGRMGFIYDDSEVTRFYPNKTQKYMWHFWGEDEEFDGELKIVGTHETEEQVTILESDSVGGANHGAERHLPSNFSLPTSGMWKLDAYFDNDLFGSIYVRVH